MNASSPHSFSFLKGQVPPNQHCSVFNSTRYCWWLCMIVDYCWRLLMVVDDDWKFFPFHPHYGRAWKAIARWTLVFGSGSNLDIEAIEFSQVPSKFQKSVNMCPLFCCHFSFGEANYIHHSSPIPQKHRLNLVNKNKNAVQHHFF